MPGKASELATRSTRRVCLQGEGRDTKGVAHHQLAEKERPGYLIQASLKQFRPPQCRNWDFQMTPETLQSLLQRGETLDVEFKGEEHRPLQDHEFGVAFCQISPTRPNGCSNHWCARASLFSGRPAKRPGMDSARKIRARPHNFRACPYMEVRLVYKDIALEAVQDERFQAAAKKANLDLDVLFSQGTAVPAQPAQPTLFSSPHPNDELNGHT